MSLKELQTCDWVYALCHTCGGFWFGAADIRGNRTAIKEALYGASKLGDSIVWQTAEQMKSEGGKVLACKCWVDSE